MQYVDLKTFVRKEEELKGLIDLLSIIFSPIKGLKLYKRYQSIFKRYILKNIKKLQAEILLRKNTIDEEPLTILKRYGVYGVVFKFVKKEAIHSYFEEIARAKDKKEELEMIFKILEREKKGLIDFKKIEIGFLNLYISKFTDMYEISLTEKFVDLFNLFVRANQFNLFDTQLNTCLNANFSFEYMMNIFLFENILGKFKTFINKNEDIFVRNADKLKSMPKSNLNFILDSLIQIDIFERNYRFYLANKILKRENLDLECDVMMEPLSTNMNEDVAKSYESGNEEHKDLLLMEEFDIEGRGKMVMRSKIFRKSLYMLQNHNEPVLDFRWPKYEEVTFSLEPEMKSTVKYNKTLSTIKLKIDKFVVICTLFQYTTIKYILENYMNKNLIFNKIQKNSFESMEDKRNFFRCLLKNENEEGAFYDHIDPICYITNNDLSLTVTQNLNLCPDFRLVTDKALFFVQNDDFKLDAKIMRKLKKAKKCKMNELFSDSENKSVIERVKILQQKGYCVKSGDTVTYCP